MDEQLQTDTGTYYNIVNLLTSLYEKGFMLEDCYIPSSYCKDLVCDFKEVSKDGDKISVCSRRGISLESILTDFLRELK